jgi:hypothetical protein
MLGQRLGDTGPQGVVRGEHCRQRSDDRIPPPSTFRVCSTVDGMLGRPHVFAGHLEQPVAPLGRVCLACHSKQY